MDALRISDGLSIASLAADQTATLAVLKCIEIIGEAASRVSPECQDENPLLPWAAMTAMRNHLVHVYFDVDMQVVWDTLHEDLPALISRLDQLLDK